MARRTRWRGPTRLPGTPRWLRIGIGRRGVTSIGVSAGLGVLGRLAYNLTHRRVTWDHPGPGSVVNEPEPRRRRRG